MFPSSPVLPYSYGCNSPSLPNDSLLLLPPSCFLSPIGSFEYQQSTVLTNESSCCSSEMTRTMVPPISYHSNSSVTITHSYHPFFYPSEEEMRQLCEESGLTTLIERKCAEISAYDWSPSKRSPKCDSVNRPTKSDSANRTAKPWKELEGNKPAAHRTTRTSKPFFSFFADTAELQIRRLAKDIARLRLDEKMERMDLQDELATQPEYKAFTPHQASTPLFTEKPLKRISTNGSIGKSMKRKLEVSMLGNKENRQQPREKKSRKINRKLSESKISVSCAIKTFPVHITIASVPALRVLQGQRRAAFDLQPPHHQGLQGTNALPGAATNRVPDLLRRWRRRAHDSGLPATPAATDGRREKPQRSTKPQLHQNVNNFNLCIITDVTCR